MTADHPYAKGGLIPGDAQIRQRIMREADCPNGHPTWRINGARYREHLVKLGDTESFRCPHAVIYDGGES